MSYRDELEAAVQRAEQSARDLAEERAKSAVKDQQIANLQAQLAQAQMGITPVVQPGAITSASHAAYPLAVVMQWFMWALAAFAALSIAAAATQSESKGVAMAQLVGALPFAALAGQLTIRRPFKRYVASLALGLFGGAAVISLFFAAVWPSL
jgi:hypothetical protein